jgi:hypothetical protein
MGMSTVVYLYCDGGPVCPLNGEVAWAADAGHVSRDTCKKDAIKEGGVFAKPNEAYCPDCVRRLQAHPCAD